MRTELDRGLWEIASQRLRDRLGADIFERWFGGLSLVADDRCVTVGVPNAFVLEWIRERYLRALTEVCRDAIGHDIDLKLRVDPALFRKQRRDQEDAFREAPEPSMELGVNAPFLDGGAKGRAAGFHRRRRGGSTDHSLESFVLGASNQLAGRAVLEVLGQPGEIFNPFFVFGGSGVGKTHLARGLYRAYQRGGRCRLGGRVGSEGDGVGSEDDPPQAFVTVPSRLKVRYVTAERFFNHYVASLQDGSLRKFHESYRSLDVLIVDDIQLLESKKKTQIEFLHTFNSLIDQGKQVIVTGDRSPRELEGLDRSLTGRFLSGLVTRIRKPDYETRLAILRMHARRLSSDVRPEVFECVAETIRGSARELIGALMQLDAEALASARTLDEDAARKVLNDRLRVQQLKKSLRRIHQVVAEHYELSEETLLSANRQRVVARARHVAMYLARHYTRESLAQIGKYFGNRNHTTVQLAIGKITKLLESADPSLSRDIDMVVETLEGA